MLQPIKMEVQQVTTKYPKKVEAGKKLTEYNCKKKEKLKVQKSESKQLEPKITLSQYSTFYGVRDVLVVGVIGCGLGYYVYNSKEGDVNTANIVVPNNPPQQPSHPHAPHPQAL